MKPELPIPLTCRPDVHDGRCSHALDGGACDLPDQFMCPYFLHYVKTNGDDTSDAGEVSIPILVRLRQEKPISVEELLSAQTSRKNPGKKAATKTTKPAAKAGKQKAAAAKKAVKESSAKRNGSRASARR